MRSRALWLSLGWLALGSVAAWAQETRQELTVPAGQSVVVDSIPDIAWVTTSDPDIVDAVAVSTREVVVQAKKLGMGTVVIGSRSGRRLVSTVLVEQNLAPLRKLLHDTFPNDDIQLQGTRDSLSLTGVASNKDVADRAAALLAPFAKAVVNNLRVTPEGPQRQVLLRVKFAEINRNVADSFGVNLISTGLLNTIGGTTTGQFQAPQPTELKGAIPGRNEGTTSQFSISDALNVFAFRPDLNLAAFIRALQSKGVLQILAEPNLVATNGKEASFLVGGEFPVPIVQGGANAGAITILFKEFGIRLTFKPEITEHDSIRMYVKPEVSTIDLANSVSLGGFTIPALATRRMETNIELGVGQSFVIAGLIDDRVTESLSKIPGLAHIPILGALFKSRSENRTKTELVVMVTPEIAEPISAAEARKLPHMPKQPLAPQMSMDPNAPAAAPGGTQNAEKKK
jgi:pilus assembly protein CpaC